MTRLWRYTEALILRNPNLSKLPGWAIAGECCRHNSQTFYFITLVGRDLNAGARELLLLGFEVWAAEYRIVSLITRRLTLESIMNSEVYGDRLLDCCVKLPLNPDSIRSSDEQRRTGGSGGREDEHHQEEC